MSPETRRIKEAACRYEGKVHTGHRHRQAFDALIAFRGTPEGIVWSEVEQGFVTEDGEFEDRWEAAQKSGTDRETSP